MTELPKPAAVVFCANLPLLTGFYQAVADMAFVSGDADHSVLEVEGFQLVVHALKGEPPPEAPRGEISPREDTYVKVCLPVESIAVARSRAATLGGRIQPPEREWLARGFRACDGHDPEGNVFQVREPAN